MEKEQIYRQTTSQIKSLIDGVDNKVGALANVAAALKETFSYYFWVGFYIVKGEVLELGPFQGPVACYTIMKGKGVCGTAWELRKTIVVPDVEKFPGHIACSSKSRSEIVVPVFKGSDVVAVIDVDSANLNAFDDKDKEGLETIAKILLFHLSYLEIKYEDLSCITIYVSQSSMRNVLHEISKFPWLFH